MTFHAAGTGHGVGDCWRVKYSVDGIEMWDIPRYYVDDYLDLFDGDREKADIYARVQAEEKRMEINEKFNIQPRAKKGLTRKSLQSTATV